MNHQVKRDSKEKRWMISLIDQVENKNNKNISIRIDQVAPLNLFGRFEVKNHQELLDWILSNHQKEILKEVFSTQKLKNINQNSQK